MASPPASPLRIGSQAPATPAPQGLSSGAEPDGRTRHYGQFYGLDKIPQDDRPLVFVWGNCQAEALRILLSESPSRAVRSVRMPPVHEIDHADLPCLRRLLERADILLAQPVTCDYRGLPLGTAQIARGLRPRARVVRLPSLFFAGLYPYQALVRQPGIGDPPVVPYHDLRTILEASTGRAPVTTLAPSAFATACRAIVEDSRRSLARREAAHETIVVSDVLNELSADLCHTINHPGNTWLLAAARRVQRALGVPEDAAEPGRVLLSSVITPLEEQVIEGLRLNVEPRRQWRCSEQVVDPDAVREAQLDFYAKNPGFVQEGMRRHATTIEALGLR